MAAGFIEKLLDGTQRLLVLRCSKDVAAVAIITVKCALAAGADVLLGCVLPRHVVCDIEKEFALLLVVSRVAIVRGLSLLAFKLDVVC